MQVCTSMDLGTRMLCSPPPPSYPHLLHLGFLQPSGWGAGQELDSEPEGAASKCPPFLSSPQQETFLGSAFQCGPSVPITLGSGLQGCKSNSESIFSQVGAASLFYVRLPPALALKKKSHNSNKQEVIKK